MEPIRCFECGSPISDKWDIFVELRAWLLSKEDDTDKKFIDPDLNQNLIPVFTALDIENYCCRQHFASIKNIHNF